MAFPFFSNTLYIQENIRKFCWQIIFFILSKKKLSQIIFSRVYAFRTIFKVNSMAETLPLPHHVTLRHAELITVNHLGAWVKDNAFFYMQSVHGYFSQYGVYQVVGFAKN